jgi:CDP-diacylglycerol--glycerol-3-phosphate 3-phosphatidyltransferase
MKLADRLTLSRIVLAPIFFIFYTYFAPETGRMPVVASLAILWSLFVVMELTDLLDGWVARKKDGSSDFGKLFDPFADVLVHVTLFACFSRKLPEIPEWFLPLVIYREFGITFIRMLLLGRGVSMGARPGGKAKSFLYMLVSAASMLLLSFKSFSSSLEIKSVVSTSLSVLVYVSAAMAIVSFVDYFIQFKKLYRK